jgi:hypothetical protein
VAELRNVTLSNPIKEAAMQTQHSQPLDLTLLPATRELSEHDLEHVASGKDFFGGVGMFSRYGGFVGSFPSINIPNFFGS